MSPVPQDAVPTGRPTELEGTGVLDVAALVASGLRVEVPARRALDEPLLALLPLVEGARSPGAQGSGRGGRRLRVTVEITDETDPAGLLDQVQVQETDDGFRQRRWLVSHYVTVWNVMVDQLNGLGPDDRERAVSSFTARLESRREQAARLVAADLGVVYVGEAGERSDLLPDLFARQVAALAAIKVAETGRHGGVATMVDPAVVAAAARVDARGARPLGVLNALAYDARSPMSTTAAWGYVTDGAGKTRANFKTKDFYEWASAVTGYNEQYVRDALADTFDRIKRSDRPTQGKRGSVYLEVVRVLRERADALFRTDPARRLWAQSVEGTTLDGPVGPSPSAGPGRPKPC